MARHHALPIPSSELNFPHSIQSEGTGSVIDTGSSTLAIQTLGGRDTSTAARPAMAPSLWKDLLSQGRGGGICLIKVKLTIKEKIDGLLNVNMGCLITE